ncbi:PREDICTED: uncharacterized protein LOC109586180 [Amphimedon queenslandica]|uniref:Death domain-containing protein n=1 Tax=Amphimedon queenslandica TaxID=400682 RepID=A0AAN0JMB9_AMPQE|nr:PREDICTED: uncharacterized protein LOC109586180 [Amphimedon queenslandica]|eukprot:XP_019857910.1 PREDICTED: uncharacterized protein LOC109586180 [Amphimedon queenslandica]
MSFDRAFDAFLSSPPTIKELTGHVDASTNWYIIGTMLDLDQKRLRSIEALAGHTDTHKMIEMFNLWLTTTPTASRRQVLDVLRIRVVGENTLADEYEKHLKELHETIYMSPSTEAVSILQRNIESLNEALVSPVQVSQLLYCKRCISEATLDEMERIDQRRSLDDKKTTLLTAMQETVSSDYRKLKDIATVLSDVEQTRDIANEIMTKYEETIPQEDDSTVVQPQEVVGGNEDRASDILRNNYSALSQSITEPVRVAKWLHEEVNLISDEDLSCVMSTSRAVLLKAVRDAVHSNYKHLELFVTVLRKFSETTHIGDTIFEEYRKHFCYYDDDVEESECYLSSRSTSNPESSSFVDREIDKHGDHKILFPHYMKKKFQVMRMKFGSTFFQVRRIFARMKSVNIDEVKDLISDWFSDLKPQLSDKKTINDVLNVLKRKCSIINLHPLENLASELNIEEAEPIIKLYKEKAKDFCMSISVSLCLGEELQAVATSSCLLCETVVFIFNWDPDEHTLQDINDVLLELEPLNRFKYHLQIDKVDLVDNDQSVVDLFKQTQTSLTSGDIDDLNKEIKAKDQEIENFKAIIREKEMKSDTEVMDLQYTLKDKEEKMTAVIKKYEFVQQQLNAKDDEVNALTSELASVKELSESQLQQIEKLKLRLEESHKIIDEKDSEFDSMQKKTDEDK